MKYLLTILCFFLIGCSGRPTIGMKDQVFGEKAKHIVWIQIPGLSLEHLAFLKMDLQSANEKVSFERMNCVGGSWSFNLKELRPNFSSGFNSQILGSKNVKGTCEDLDRNPVWSYYERAGYSSAIYEAPARGLKSFTELNSCSTNFNPMKNSVVWIQDRLPNESYQTFHFQENPNQNKVGVYYDKSCSKKGCYSKLRDNVVNLWKSFSQELPKTFLMVRDASFIKAIRNKKYLEAKEALVELNQVVDFFLAQSGVSLVVTSSEAMGIEFPKAGRSWEMIEKRGLNVNYKRSQLLAPVFAHGPGAENFCGVYEESEIFKRFLWNPEKNILDLVF